MSGRKSSLKAEVMFSAHAAAAAAVAEAAAAAAAAAAAEQPAETLQRPRRWPPPTLAGSLLGWRRRPCGGGPRHVLPPVKGLKQKRKSSLVRDWRRTQPLLTWPGHG